MHAFATQSQREAYQSWKDGYVESINTKSITDETVAKKILAGFLKGLQNEEDPEFKEAVKDLHEILNTANDMRNNRMTDALKKAYGATDGAKGVTSSVMPMMPRTVVEFRNMFNEDDIDDYWMMVYITDVVTDSMAMSLADVKNLVSFKRLKSANDKLPFGDFMKSTWENMEAIYYGGGVAASEEILKKDPLTTVNNIIIAIRIAAEVLKTAEATVNIQAAIVAADAAGYTTAYTASSIIKTLNRARRTLIQRNKGKGFNLNGNTQVVLIANEALRGDIEAQFLQTNNVAFGTVQVSYPITRVYTENVADTLGLSGAVKAVMVLPYRKNRFGLFKSLDIRSWEDPETNSRKVGGREGYNFLTNEEQFEIAVLA